METFDSVAARAHIQVSSLHCFPPYSELNGLLQAERVEAERLRGLVDVLRKRCDELESSSESSARALRNERARAVDLERRAESAGAGKRIAVHGKPSTPGADKVREGCTAALADVTIRSRLL